MRSHCLSSLLLISLLAALTIVHAQVDVSSASLTSRAEDLLNSMPTAGFTHSDEFSPSALIETHSDSDSESETETDSFTTAADSLSSQIDDASSIAEQVEAEADADESSDADAEDAEEDMASPILIESEGEEGGENDNENEQEGDEEGENESENDSEDTVDADADTDADSEDELENESESDSDAEETELIGIEDVPVGTALQPAASPITGAGGALPLASPSATSTPQPPSKLHVHLTTKLHGGAASDNLIRVEERFDEHHDTMMAKLNGLLAKIKRHPDSIAEKEEGSDYGFDDEESKK